MWGGAAEEAWQERFPLKVSGGGSPGQLPECLGVGASLAPSALCREAGRLSGGLLLPVSLPLLALLLTSVCRLAAPLCPSDGPSPLIWRANVASVQGGEAWLESVVALSPDAQFL